MDFRNMWELFFQEELEDEYLALVRERHIKIPNFYENIVGTYSLNDFKTHFRVEKRTFEQLVQEFGPLLYTDRGPNKISPDKQIAISLWFFGNQEVYRCIGDRFGVSKDTVWRCVLKVSKVLCTNVHNYIKWPEPLQMDQSQQKFANIANLPGVIGAIDGCHIQISAPVTDSHCYINRKGYHSILLQGICDTTLKFIDVFTGICGSVHDSRVWYMSDIRHLIVNNNHRYFRDYYYIIGDAAYPLSNRLLTPYRDNGHLQHWQINYNTKHAKTRVVIERAFGILLGRFRKLKYIYVYNTEFVPLIILACCILHNICINNEEEEMVIDPVNMHQIDLGADLEGNIKRDTIAHLL